MQISVLNKFLVVLVGTLGTFLLSCGDACAERAIVQVTQEEFKRLSYQDKDDFMNSYAKCVAISNNLKKNNMCIDDDCVKNSREWVTANCNKHSTAMFYLTTLKPAQYPVSSVFDASEKANYVRLYTASCQDGYKTMNTGGDVAIAKTICECAANQSLDLIEYSDFKGFESPSASKDVVDRVKNRAAYARFICENLPFVWRTQPVDVGQPGGGAAAGGKGQLPDGKLTPLFEQLKMQGSGLYNNLLAKLTAEAKDRTCEDDDSCKRVDEALGDVYKDILYAVYAIQIYKSADECNRAIAKNKLNDFVKAALLSVEPNVKYVRSIVGNNKGKANSNLLVKAFGDAENCYNTLVNISRELDKK